MLTVTSQQNIDLKPSMAIGVINANQKLLTRTDKMLTSAPLPRFHPKQCKSILEKARWNNEFDRLTPTCPYCKSKKITRQKSSQPYKCQSCRISFTIRTKTFLHGVKINYTSLVRVLFGLSFGLKASEIADYANVDSRSIRDIALKFNNKNEERQAFCSCLKHDLKIMAERVDFYDL